MTLELKLFACSVCIRRFVVATFVLVMPISSLADELDEQSRTRQSESAATDAGNQLREFEDRVKTLLDEQERLLRQAEESIARLRLRERLVFSEAERKALAEQRAAAEAILSEVQRERVKRSRTHYVARDSEPIFKQYRAEIAALIEAHGRKEPTSDNGAPIYGKVIISVMINSAGEIEEKNIEKGSGNRKLDEHALAILREVSPFRPFRGELKARVDRVFLVLPFEFSRTHEKT